MPLDIISLPAELLERVITELDLDSIKSLRKTCIALSVKSIGPRFCSFFACHETDLTEQSLARLASIASHPDLSRSVTTLKLSAVVYDPAHAEARIKDRKRWKDEESMHFNSSMLVHLTDDELDEAKADLEWVRLQQASQDGCKISHLFRPLTELLKSFKSLATIEVDCRVGQRKGKPDVPYLTKKWPMVFWAASQASQVTMAAIMYSNVQLLSLSICFDTIRCSVPLNGFTSELEDLIPDWRNCRLSSIRRFSISLTPDATELEQGNESRYRELTSSDSELDLKNHVSGFQSFIHLLRLMNNLEDLKVHSYNGYLRLPVDLNRTFLDKKLNVKFPNLRNCGIYNMRTEEIAMLDWLRRHPNLENLELAEISLGEGNWKPIFDHISKMPQLQRVKLSNLWAQRLQQLRLVHEKDTLPEHRAFRCLDGNVTHTNEFVRQDFVDGFRFAPKPLRRQLGSPRVANWLHQRKKLFGPP